MCGIHGIISKTFSEKEILYRLERMGEVQQHRGPDDTDQAAYELEECKVGFGFVRLEILDLETGMQPIVSHRDGSAIICNGQIYNYIELQKELPGEWFVTKGDIEVALHLYGQIGIKFLYRLNGMYAGAIYDRPNRRLLLFRDRFGIKPLYYTLQEGNFFFASEIKPLLAATGQPPSLNQNRLKTFFSYRYAPGEETMFDGIRRLPPGSFLEYDLRTGRYEVQRYWEYRLDLERPDMSLEEAEEQFYVLFSDAVRIRMRSDVEVGTLISGGIDSSAVAAQAATLQPDIRLFTISFAEKPYDELPSVKQFIRDSGNRFTPGRHFTRPCGKENLDNLPQIVRSLEDLISLGTVIPTDQVCGLASEHVKVVLTGEGADEVFAGYRKFLIETAALKYPHLSAGEQKELENRYPELVAYMRIRKDNPVERYIQSELLFETNQLEELLGLNISKDITPSDALPSLSGREHPLNAALAMESRFRLPDYVILRLDKLSMRHSLEARTPFLDYRLAKFAATVPVDFKIHLDNGQEKYLCRHSFVKRGILDRHTAFRKKLPFTIPLAHWLSQPQTLPGFFQDILVGDLVANQGILNPNLVKSLQKSISTEDVRPETLVSQADKVWAVCMFTMWYDIFFMNH